MHSVLKVAVKFCGNCNPHISPKDILKGIKTDLEKRGAQIEWVPLAEADTDVLLVISGCEVDCASRPQGDYEEITVAGESVNSTYCSPDGLPTEVAKILVAKSKTS